MIRVTGWAAGLAISLLALNANATFVASAQQAGQFELLRYLGSFRVPSGPQGSSSFAYGGGAMAYRADTDSLYITGHDHQQMVAEVSVPAIRKGALNELAYAAVRQPFRDVTEGKLQAINPGASTAPKIGGLLVHANKLIVSAYTYYDASHSQVASHFISGLDLSLTGDVDGPIKLPGANPGHVGGRMAEVPPEWVNAFGDFLTGLCCIPIVSRTSYGPSAFGVSLSGIRTQAVRASIFYPSTDPLDEWGETSTVYNGSTTIGGLVVLGREIVYFGNHGIGKFCYGTGEECGDPTIPQKGNHAYPYQTTVWRYDISEAARAASGAIAPSNVRPKSVERWSFPFNLNGTASLQSVAFDSPRSRLFVAQRWVDSDRPLIHVFDLSGSPGSPTNLKFIP